MNSDIGDETSKSLAQCIKAIHPKTVKIDMS